MSKASQTRAILRTACITACACLLSQAATVRAAPGRPEIATNPAQRVTELADAYMKAWLEAFPEKATTPRLRVPGTTGSPTTPSPPSSPGRRSRTISPPGSRRCARSRSGVPRSG